MRYPLSCLFLLIALNLSAQQLVIDDASDSLVIPKKDSIFKVPFSLKGTSMDNNSVVKIYGTSEGGAKVKVDFDLIRWDSLRVDTLEVTARNRSSFFLLKLSKDVDTGKSIFVRGTILDQGKPTAFVDTIWLIAQRSNIAPKKPEKKDSVTINLYDDDEIVIQDTICEETKRRFMFIKAKMKDSCTANIQEVDVQLGADGKLYLNVLTADGEVYSNVVGIEIKKQFSRDDKLYLDKGKKKPFLYAMDFLEFFQAQEKSEIQVITPKNPKIKIPTISQAKQK